jgi:hypothetical protein
LRRDIGESSVAVVVIERVPPGAANEDVFKAVVIVIANSDSQIVAEVFAEEPGFGGDIFESAVAFVAQQRVIERRAGLLQRRW